MRKIIRQEIRIGLILEGLYYPDIERWSIVVKIKNRSIRNSRNVIIETRNFDPIGDYL